MKTQAQILLAGLLLAGCTTPADEPLPEFGEAVRNNMAAHIINPTPPPSMELPPADGNRRALMIQRYQRDKVETPVETTTSTLAIEAAPK